jgi:hypothetical protein
LRRNGRGEKGKTLLGNFGVVLGELDAGERVIRGGGDRVRGHFLNGDAKAFAVRALRYVPVLLRELDVAVGEMDAERIDVRNALSRLRAEI